MPKRARRCTYAGLVGLAVLLILVMVGCERDVEDRTVILPDVDNDIDTPDMKPAGSMRDTIGTPPSVPPSAPTTQPAAGTPPTAGNTVPPSPNDGEVDVGDKMPEPGSTPSQPSPGASTDATGGTAGQS